MPPPDTRKGGPRQDRPPDSTPTSATITGQSVPRTDRRLLQFLDEQQQRVDEARRQGYLVGRADGWQAGHDAAHNEVADDFRRLAKRVHRTANQATRSERASMDTSAAAGEPCARRREGKCSGCSRCIRAAAVARRGGDYTGGPVDWETGRPLSEGE